MQEFYPISSWALFHNNYHPDFSWPIDGLKEKLTRRQEPITIVLSKEDFAWYAYPRVRARAQLIIDHESGMISASLNLFPRDPQEPLPRIRPVPTVYYVLRDRRSLLKGNDRPQHVVRAFAVKFRSTFNWNMQFPRPLVDKSWLGPNTLYNVEDSIVLEVFVEPPGAARTAQTYDGTLDWWVENVDGRKEAQTYTGAQESPYFYTGPGGYRVQARMRFVGAEEKEGLEVELAFLSGSSDFKLASSFAHRATVSLHHPAEVDLSVDQTVDTVVKGNRWTYAVVLPTAAFPPCGCFNVKVRIESLESSSSDLIESLTSGSDK